MNVLVSDEAHCLISDFGLCTLQEETTAERANLSTSQVILRGSVPWLAPELMNPGCVETPNRTTRDVYALGCTMYEVRGPCKSYRRFGTDYLLKAPQRLSSLRR